MDEPTTHAVIQFFLILANMLLWLSYTWARSDAAKHQATSEQLEERLEDANNYDAGGGWRDEALFWREKFAKNFLPDAWPLKPPPMSSGSSDGGENREANT